MRGESSTAPGAEGEKAGGPETRKETMCASLDRNGQPVNYALNSGRRSERDISEMLGLAKGVLADGAVSAAEAELLHAWLGRHPEVLQKWPVNRLVERLETIFHDGRVTREEQDDLKELLSDLVGGNAGIIVGEGAATALPIDRPAPSVVFPDRVFVFTGKFAFGPRAVCQRFVRDAGGSCDNDVTRRTNYLVIGTFGSRDWIQASYGRKIEQAVEYRESGQVLSIIAEDHWAASLP